MVSIEEWKKKFLITKWRDIPVYGKEDSVCQDVNPFLSILLSIDSMQYQTKFQQVISCILAKLF